MDYVELCWGFCAFIQKIDGAARVGVYVIANGFAEASTVDDAVAAAAMTGIGMERVVEDYSAEGTRTFPGLPALQHQ